MEKVLVLLSTYNGEKYLEEQVDSILNQKNVDVSILVRDDGSSDNTIKILNKYSNKGKLNYYNNGHLGAKYSFLDLIYKCNNIEADYFALSDQDDVWLNDKLKIAIDYLNKSNNKNGKLYYSGQILTDDKLNIINYHYLNTNRSDKARFIFNDAAGCTEVFDKALVNSINKYRPQYLLMHDAWLLKVCIILGGELIVDKDCHMYYRQHSNNEFGLKNDLVSKLKRAYKYIYEQDVEKQTRELVNGYKNIDAKYVEFVNNVLNYKLDNEIKSKLANDPSINFADRMLKILYNIKLLINKL